jgi:hypothetical protein
MLDTQSIGVVRLLDVEPVTGALPVVDMVSDYTVKPPDGCYPAATPDGYYPVEFRSGRWAILHMHITGEGEDEDGLFDICDIEWHRGRYTGKIVTFSRLSDVERLCSVLNSEG